MIEILNRWTGAVIYASETARQRDELLAALQDAFDLLSRRTTEEERMDWREQAREVIVRAEGQTK